MILLFIDESNPIEFKYMYSNKNTITMFTNTNDGISIETSGFDDNDIITFELVNNNNIITLSDTMDNSVTITALAPGKEIIKIYTSDANIEPIYININVLSSDIIEVSKSCYLSTVNNVISFPAPNLSKTIEINP